MVVRLRPQLAPPLLVIPAWSMVQAKALVEALVVHRPVAHQDSPVSRRRAALRVPGVSRVEARGAVGGVGTYVLEADRARDVRRDVVQLVTQQRWGLLELRSLALSLEDLFIRAVAGEEHGEHGEPGGEEGREAGEPVAAGAAEGQEAAR